MLGHRTLEVSEYAGMVKRHALLIAFPGLLFAILGVAVTFVITPRYVSQTLILIDQQKVPEDIVKPVINSDLDARLSSMKEQILSRSSLQPIIERYRLYANKRLSLDERIDLVRKDVMVKPIQSQIAQTGGLPGFFISFTARDARTAQVVCGELSSLFVGENLRSRENDAEGTTDFLHGQLEDAKRNLDEQDAKLAAFQRQYIGKLPGESGTNINMLTSLNTQLEAATQELSRMEQDRTYQQALLAQQVQAQDASRVSANSGSEITTSNPANLSSTPGGQQQAQLRALLATEIELRSHYTAEHPDVVNVERQIASLRRDIAASSKADTLAPNSPASNPTTPTRYDTPEVQQMRAQLHASEVGVQAKRAEQAQLQSAVRTYQDRIQSTPLVEEQFKELTRDYDTAKKFYDDLLSKSNQSKMATDLERQQQGQQFRVLDPPNLPDSPTFPKRSAFLAAGLLFGLMLGAGLAAFLEFRDTALRTERDVYAFTQLPTLAVIALSEELGGQSMAASRPRFLARFLAPNANKSLLGGKRTHV